MQRASLLMVFLVSAAFLAGCAASEGPSGADDAGLSPEGEAPALEPEESYRLDVWGGNWDKTELLIVVQPPGYGQPGEVDPFEATFTRGVLDAITHWEEAIAEHGTPEMRGGNVSFDVRVLGRDVVLPTESIDILVANGPFVAALGGFALQPAPPFKCLASNFGTPVVQDYQWMFYVAAHEVGHCLGLDHPVDHKPWVDIMSYDYIHQPADAEPPRLHCVSNLNLLVLHEAFAPAFGRERVEFVEVHDVDYVVYEECAERFLE